MGSGSSISRQKKNNIDLNNHNHHDDNIATQQLHHIVNNDSPVKDVTATDLTDDTLKRLAMGQQQNSKNYSLSAHRGPIDLDWSTMVSNSSKKHDVDNDTLSDLLHNNEQSNLPTLRPIRPSPGVHKISTNNTTCSSNAPQYSLVIAPTTLTLPTPARNDIPELIDDILSPAELQEFNNQRSTNKSRIEFRTHPMTSTAPIYNPNGYFTNNISPDSSENSSSNHIDYKNPNAMKHEDSNETDSSVSSKSENEEDWFHSNTNSYLSAENMISLQERLNITPIIVDHGEDAFNGRSNKLKSTSRSPSAASPHTNRYTPMTNKRSPSNMNRNQSNSSSQESASSTATTAVGVGFYTTTNCKTNASTPISQSNKNSSKAIDESQSIDAVESSVVNSILSSHTVKETRDVRRNIAQLPTKYNHPTPTAGDWLNKRYFVNNYILLNALGKGSYGEVRLCKDRTSRNDNAKNLFAMKIISKDMMRKKKGGNTSETYSDDIKREIAIMKKLLHPNVLRLHEVLDDPKVNKLYLVLEYMSKGDLLTYLRGKDDSQDSTVGGNKSDKKSLKSIKFNLTEVELWNIFRQVLCGIKYLHYQNIVHGDIKPQNLLVNEDDIVKIADFGISKMIHGGNEKLKDASGTPAFLSPEQISGELFSGQLSDVYALGATIFMLVYGHPPFVAKTILSLYDKIQNEPLVFPHDINPELQDLLAKMLIKDPEKRITLQQISNHPWIQKMPLNTHNDTLNKDNDPSPSLTSTIVGISSNNQTNKEYITEDESIDKLSSIAERVSNKVFANSSVTMSTTTTIDSNSVLLSVSSGNQCRFQPPSSYNSEEQEAMKVKIGNIDDNEVFQSIILGTQKHLSQKSDVNENINDSDEVNVIYEEDDENIMHTNWGDDVFEIVEEAEITSNNVFDTNDAIDNYSDDSDNDTVDSNIDEVTSNRKDIAFKSNMVYKKSDSKDSTLSSGTSFGRISTTSDKTLKSSTGDLTPDTTPSSDKLPLVSIKAEVNSNKSQITGVNYLTTDNVTKLPNPQDIKDMKFPSLADQMTNTDDYKKLNLRKDEVTMINAPNKLMKTSNIITTTTAMSSVTTTARPSTQSKVNLPSLFSQASENTQPTSTSLENSDKGLLKQNQLPALGSSKQIMAQEEEERRSRRFQVQCNKKISLKTIEHLDHSPRLLLSDNTVEVVNKMPFNDELVDDSSAKSKHEGLIESESNSSDDSSKDSLLSTNSSLDSGAHVISSSTKSKRKLSLIRSRHESTDDMDLQTDELSMDEFNTLMDTLAMQPKIAYSTDEADEVDVSHNSLINKSTDSTDSKKSSKASNKRKTPKNSNKNTSQLPKVSKSSKDSKDSKDSKVSNTSSIISPSSFFKYDFKVPNFNSHNHIGCAMVSEQGKRVSQEDRCVLIPDLAEYAQQIAAMNSNSSPSRDLTPYTDQLRQISVGLLFDGHSGTTSAEYLSQNFAKRLIYHEKLLSNVNEALLDTCRIVDKELCQVLSNDEDDSGSTGVILLFDGRRRQLFIASTGDSMCVLSKGGKAVVLHKMHRLDDNAEKERVVKAGGTIINNRVNGILAITRAFGDVAFKDNGDQTSPIICTPSIVSEIVTPMVEFCILATDGLWDVVPTQVAVSFIRKKLNLKVDLDEAVRQLANEAVARGSADNVSIVVISFHLPSVQHDSLVIAKASVTVQK